MRYTVTRTVTVMERWYNVEAPTLEDATALIEDGEVQRPPDKDDAYNEFIEAEPDERGLGTYTLVGEFTEAERTIIARTFSTSIPAVEHAGWTITKQGDILSAVEQGEALALFATSVSRLCRSFRDVYLGHTMDDNGNNRCTSWDG